MATSSILPVARVLAPNPGPFTLEGTNTWVVGSEGSIVIDPGPDDAAHREAILEAAAGVEAILLTHHHSDHAPGAELMARASGAPVYAALPREGERDARDGDVIETVGTSLIVVPTPGHSADHLAFFHEETRSLFTGDAILGRGTSVIDPPEGDMTSYLGSLERMRRLSPNVIYPGHGPVVEPALSKIDEYLSHRTQREQQVLRGLRDGPRTPLELVPEIYSEYPAELQEAAARSVLAHLTKLEREGRVLRMGGDRFRLSSTAGGSSLDRHGFSEEPRT